MTTITIPASIAAEIHDQAVDEAPNEACGYLSGVDGRANLRIPLTNVDSSPVHFSFSPKEQFDALKKSRERGEELLAVYHSHPTSPAWMSQEDIRLAHDPNMIFAIHSLESGETKAFRVGKDRRPTEIEVRIAHEVTP